MIEATGSAGGTERAADFAAIRTERLCNDYGAGRGVFDLDLEVRRGEILGFLGPNGAGKPTTIRLLVDLIRLTAGRAWVLGLNTREHSLEIRRRMGFLPGDLAMYRKLTAAQLLDYLAALRGGINGRERDVLAERFAADLHRPIRELSSGNRQKIGLIQAFMHQPELLILDEPITGLDPLVQQRFHEVRAIRSREDGLIVGVAIAGGGIALADQAALAAHLAGFGLASGAVALALAAGTGRRRIGVAGAATFAVAGYLIAGFARLVDQLAWLPYLSPYHYYAAHDPLVAGVGIGDLAVLVAVALGFAAVGIVGVGRRDMRA